MNNREATDPPFSYQFDQARNAWVLRRNNEFFADFGNVEASENRAKVICNYLNAGMIQDKGLTLK
jgi:hypothetical protein